jgi:hypothetical protein
MTNEEKVTLDIERTGEFLRYLIDNPLEMEKIPDGSNIRFIDNTEKEEAFVNESEKVLNVRKVYEFS